MTGRLFESFVAMEVARQLSWSASSARLHHYRDRDEEVDVVLESRSGAVACIECKASATVTRADYRALGRLRDGLGGRFVACQPPILLRVAPVRPMVLLRHGHQRKRAGPEVYGRGWE